MDALHAGGVEIVSPNFMNTRALSADAVVIPKAFRRAAEIPRESAPEDLVFDKAEEAESLEHLRQAYVKVVDDIGKQEGRLKDTPEGPEHDKAQRRLSSLQSRKERLEELIAGRESAAGKGE